MDEKRLRLLFGLLINLSSLFLIVCNFVCLYCIKRGNLHLLKNNPVYLITGFNMICDSFQLSAHLFYTGPSIMFGSWFFPGGEYSTGVALVGAFVLEFWFLASWVQILLAISRFHIIIYPKHTLFTVERIVKLFLLFIMFSLLSTTAFQFTHFCCKVIPDYRVYGYSSLNYTKDRTHVSQVLIGLPYDIVCSTLCLISYIKACTSFLVSVKTTFQTFQHIYSLRKSVNTRITPREIRMSIQCCFVFLSYLMSWLTFHMFPLLEVETPEVYIITPFALVVNSGINAVIYLLFNRDIHHELKRIYSEYVGEPENTMGTTSASSVYNLDGIGS